MFGKCDRRKNEPGPGERPVLFRVIPPKSGEFSAQGFINALEALNLVDEVAEPGAVRHRRAGHDVRALGAARSRAVRARSHYGQARFATVPAGEDPLLMPGGEGTVCRQVLRPAGEQWLPFQVQDDTGEDNDPFVDMLAGLSAEMPPGGRV